MDATARNLQEAAELIDKIGDRHAVLLGRVYNRQGRISAGGEYSGLTPTQSRRAAYKEWKQVPSQVMDTLRSKYVEICERVETKTRERDEANHAAIESLRKRHSVIDGECDEASCGNPDDGDGEDDEADERTND